MSYQHITKRGATVNESVRYVWEIVMAVTDIFEAEASLVTLDLEDGMTCDVIGDVHGVFLRLL